MIEGLDVVEVLQRIARRQESARYKNIIIASSKKPRNGASKNIDKTDYHTKD